MVQPTSIDVEDVALDASKNRLFVLMFSIIAVFSILILRIFDICLSNNEDVQISRSKNTHDFFIQRASIVDRNGTILAVNLPTASVYANPQKIKDPKIAADKLCHALSNIECEDLETKLASNKTFLWIKRHLSPKEQQTVHNLGLPGISFLSEEKRVYPHGNLFAHVLGFADIDGEGISGMEKYFNKSLVQNINEPLKLSLDSRIQQIMHEEISKQIKEHSAVGGSGVLMDVKTGEVIAMVSLPDFDPHHVNYATERERFNQITLGTYEMGSTFKILTLAMGLDGQFIGVNDAFNLDIPIKIGSKTIKDYKGKGGTLSVPEILMYSSNIGTAQIAMRVGAKMQRNYLEEFGLLSTVDIELPEKSYPQYPQDKLWSQASLITISYGHGIAVTPLHLLRAMSAIVNGGNLVKPTLLQVEDPSLLESRRVISERASDTMRKIMRLVVTNGSGKKANAEGYLLGGKTGTSEKISGKSYNKKSNIASFISAFPMHDPKYAIIVLIDEATPNEKNFGYTTGGMIAAPVVGEIVPRIAPILGISPVEENDPEVVAKLAIDYTPRRVK